MKNTDSLGSAARIALYTKKNGKATIIKTRVKMALNISLKGVTTMTRRMLPISIPLKCTVEAFLINFS